MKKNIFIYFLTVLSVFAIFIPSLDARDPEITTSVAPEYLFEGSKIMFEVGNIDSNRLRWEFGDGDGAVSQAAVHTYDDPGAYDVTLTIGYGGGEIYEYTREGLVYALADTMWAGDLEFAPLVGFTPVEILVQARNSVPLDNIVIPIAYSGDLQLLYDGFTTAECRTVDFDTQIEHFRDPVTKTALIELAGNPGLPPGNGPILKLLFYAASAQDGPSR